jgi:hypothetical protein
MAERGDDLDGVDLTDQLRQHGRLVAAAGADLQHVVAGLRIDGLGHVGDDERRRDGLPIADGQGHVEIGVLPLAQRHELVAGRAAHGLDHAGVLHPGPGDLVVDHPIPRGVHCRPRLGQGGCGKRTNCETEHGRYWKKWIGSHIPIIDVAVPTPKRRPCFPTGASATIESFDAFCGF